MAFDPDRVRVVLVSPRNPLNIGAAARAMSNFGFFHLRLVNAYDVAYHEARSAVNATAVLEQSQQFATVADAISDCSFVAGTTAIGNRQLRHPLRRLEYAATEMRDYAEQGNVALLFGSEKFGLSNEDMSHCNVLAHIPTREGHPSMNLGQAVSICLYELIRSEQAAHDVPAAPRLATIDQRERVTEGMLGLLGDSGYINPVTAESTGEKIRRLIARMRLIEADAPVWLGIIRQVRWRLQQADRSAAVLPPPPED